jgi:hypothetical protein
MTEVPENGRCKPTRARLLRRLFSMRCLGDMMKLHLVPYALGVDETQCLRAEPVNTPTVALLVFKQPLRPARRRS